MKEEQKITPAMTVNQTDLCWKLLIAFINCTKDVRPISFPNTKKYKHADNENRAAPIIVYSSCY